MGKMLNSKSNRNNKTMVQVGAKRKQSSSPKSIAGSIGFALSLALLLVLVLVAFAPSGSAFPAINIFKHRYPFYGGGGGGGGFGGYGGYGGISLGSGFGSWGR